MFIRSPVSEYIFIHVTKTGGMTIRKLLGSSMRHAAHEVDRVDRHYTYSDYVSKHGAKDLYSFAFVRNPWERMISLYMYMYPAARHAFEKDKFIELLDRPIGRPQIEYLTGANGHIAVTKIGRFERLEEDFKEICRYLRLPVHFPLVPHLNRTAHGPYQDYYDDDLRELVARRFRDDIEAFGYMWNDRPGISD